MSALKTFTLILVFVFEAFFFPELQSATANATGSLSPVIHQLPIILLASTLLLIGYSIYRGRSS
jgi:hypothetical protein